MAAGPGPEPHDRPRGYGRARMGAHAGSPAPLTLTSDGKGVAEALEGLDRIAGGPPLERNDAVVREAVEGRGDRGVVDLAGAGFAPPGDVGDLDLADERQ